MKTDSDKTGKYYPKIRAAIVYKNGKLNGYTCSNQFKTCKAFKKYLEEKFQDDKGIILKIIVNFAKD